jgi:hypothetical protein
MNDDFLTCISTFNRNLREQRARRLEEIGTISQMLEPSELVEQFWSSHPGLPENPRIQSLSTYTLELNSMVSTSNWICSTADVSSARYVASGVASYYAETGSPVSTVFLRSLESLDASRQTRDLVYQALLQHIRTIAEMFLSAWQTLEIPPKDPARGPAFLMREVVGQILDFLAPKDEVRRQSWWTPCDGKQGVSRKDRARFIVEMRVVPGKRTRLLQDQVVRFAGLYDDFSKAHSRSDLNQDFVKSKMSEAQDLLRVLLDAVGPAPK